MPKIESTPLTPEAEALVGRARDLLKGAKPGVPVTIPADLMHAINDEVLKASMPALLARRRLEWLHSRDSHNVDGYEWGVFRVKWGADGRAEEVWQTNGDFSDLDAAMGASPQAKSAPTAPGEGEVQPVARVLRITGQYHTGSFCGEFESSAPLSEGMPLYTRPAGAPAAAVPTLTDARILEIGHRKATTYAHRSDPKYHSYAFVPHTLIDFARAIERELRNPGAAAQVSENKENGGAAATIGEDRP